MNSGLVKGPFVGPPRTAGGLAWGFTTPKGPGGPRTDLFLSLSLSCCLDHKPFSLWRLLGHRLHALLLEWTPLCQGLATGPETLAGTTRQPDLPTTLQTLQKTLYSLGFHLRFDP